MDIGKKGRLIAPTGYTYDERMLLHRDPEDDHPEQPSRLINILETFETAGLLEKCKLVPAGDLPIEALKQAHSVEHLQFVDNIPEHSPEMLLEMSKGMDSLYLCPDSEVSAKTAVSLTVNIALEVASGNLSNGFAIVRPPGHHAEPNQAMGFCLYNNVAVAIKELQQRSLAKRILILDWDIHHGNGTQKIFATDPNVLFISIHRYDGGRFYPNGVEGAPEYVGADPAKGKSVNIGWDGSGATDADYATAFYKVVLPIANEFQPDFVFVSAGFDAAEGDPIGDCNVTPIGYATMTNLLMSLANGRILLVLEGGYNVPVVAKCAEACLRALLGEFEHSDQIQNSIYHQPSSFKAAQSIEATIKAHSMYWKSLSPRIYSPSNASLTHLVPLQKVFDVYWSNYCCRTLKLIPMPISDDLLCKNFENRVFISDGVLASPKMIIVFAHESATLFSSGILESNILNFDGSKCLFPFQNYLERAIASGAAIIDINVPSRRWKLKQTQFGSNDKLTLLNELLLYLWDNFLCLSNTLNIYFVSSGLPSYAICNLSDQRSIINRVRGVVVISPTLYLPVSSTEKSEWYSGNSLVFVPTRRPAGTHIPTNSTFGSCVSSGSDDPNDITNVIYQNIDEIFNFIQGKVKST